MPLTLRPTVEAMEREIGIENTVLDHGFVRLIDYMGNDAAVVQAARTSYGEGTKTVNEDRGLLRHLMRHRHTTPFEMCEIKLHLKMPIFVARQWVRHRTASINEYSARYSVMKSEFYVPEPAAIARQSTTNKQGRDEALSSSDAKDVLETMEHLGTEAFIEYEQFIEMGVARELARINLPLSTYTEFYWKVNLHNLMHFLGLRFDEHAQEEIRVYAAQLVRLLDLWVPTSAEAFREYRLDATGLSASATALVRRWLAGERPKREETGIGEREWSDLQAVFPQAFEGNFF